MGAMLTQALQLANQQAASAQAAHAAAAAASSTPVSPSQGAAGSGQAADSPTPMDVDTGLRSRRAESYIPTLPQLNYAGMTTRHAEIKVWTSYREELTSWLCLLDDRYATELAEAETSTVEILQANLGRWKGCAINEVVVFASTVIGQVSESTRHHSSGGDPAEGCISRIRVLETVEC